MNGWTKTGTFCHRDSVTLLQLKALSTHFFYRVDSVFLMKKGQTLCRAENLKDEPSHGNNALTNTRMIIIRSMVKHAVSILLASSI